MIKKFTYKVVAVTLVLFSFVGCLNYVYAKPPLIALDKQCKIADITGNKKTQDGEVDIYDLNLVLNNWKGANKQADIWGKRQEPDGEVNAYDLSKVLSCWSKK